MQVEWYGQSAFPPIEGVEAELLLVTHEHADHNGVEAIAGSPTVLRGSAGRLQSPIGEVLAVASERDAAAGTERGSNTIFAFVLDRVRIAHLGDFGQRELRGDQGNAIGPVDLLFVPVGGGPTIDADQAAAIVDRPRPRWIVPMHYRTPTIGFLETAEPFLARMPHVQTLQSSSFELGEHENVEREIPLVIVPAVP